jgi:hypothetical protein
VSLAIQELEHNHKSELDVVKAEVPQGLLNAIDAVKGAGATPDKKTIETYLSSMNSHANFNSFFIWCCSCSLHCVNCI